MKNVTRVAFSVALAAGFILAPEAGAQSEQQGRPRVERGERMDPAQRIERRVDMMAQQLQLSTAQTHQIRQILTAEHAQMQALRQKRDGGASREVLRPEMKKIRDGSEQQINAVLNAQQQAKYKELRESMRQRRGDRPGRKA